MQVYLKYDCDFQAVLVVKNPPANEGDLKEGSIPGMEGSPRGGHDNPSSPVSLPGECLRWRILAGYSL